MNRDFTIQSSRSLLPQVFVYLTDVANLKDYRQMLLVCLVVSDNKIYRVDYLTPGRRRSCSRGFPIMHSRSATQGEADDLVITY